MRRYAFLYFLLTFYAISVAAKIDTVAIYSAAMQTSPKAIIVLPDAYSESDSSHFPVVYLLHGWSGSYIDWPKHIDLKPLADRFRYIIVCPDGGYAGWYLDSPLDSTSQYETYISGEVVTFIDQHYRTIKNRNGRALCGLSMGGYGAVRLLTLHSGRFSMAGSMSGVMDLQTSKNRYSIAALIGPFDHFPQRWQNASIIAIMKKMPEANIHLLLDCGIRDPFLATNRELHQFLLDRDIEHTYIERPGGHSWDYWTNALEYHFLFFKKHGL